MEYKLEELIDIQLFQSLQDNLNKIYSFPSAIIDLDGNVLTATAWQDVCTKFHRVNPDSAMECIKSDQYIADHLPEANPSVSYRCPHGLVDNATPIIIDGKHLGNFFIGQFFLEKPDIAVFAKRAIKYGFDEESYLKAVSAVPVWPIELLTKYLSVIKTFTEILVGIGYKNLEEKRTNEIIWKTQITLAESEKKFKAIADYAASWEAWISREGKLLWMNPFSFELTGFTPEEYLLSEDYLKMLIAPDEIQMVQGKFMDAFKGKQGDNFEARILRKDGSSFWASISWRAILDEDGQSLGIRTSTQDITHSKQIQEKLIESETRLKRAELVSKTGNWEYHLDSNMMFASEGATKIYGAVTGNLDFEDVKRVPLPEYRAMLDEAMNDLIQFDKPYNVEFKIKTLDAGEIKVINSVAVFDRESRILFGIIIDITKRKLTEESLLESNLLNKLLLKSIPFGMDIVDEEGNILFISENFKSVIEGELIGTKCWEIYRDSKTQCVSCPLHKGIRIGFTDVYETSGVLGGKTFQVSHTGMIFQGKKAMLEIFQDITEKREIEKRVKLLAQSLESISEGVTITDMNDTIIYVNQSLLRTYGYNNEELIGQTINILRPPEYVNMQVRNFLPKTTDGWRGEIINMKKDGTLFPILLSSSVIKDESGTPIALIGVALDITEMRKSREELVDAKLRAEEHNRLRSALLNNMSHEIRTPMNAIMGFSDLMKESNEEEKNKYSEIINSSSKQLLALIDEVILLSRLQSEKIPLYMDEFNPAEMVTEIGRMFNHPNLNNGVAIKVCIPENFKSCIIQTDVKKVRQVMTNFLSNAMKYTFEGSIELGFEMQGQIIEFYVKDTGIGIPESESKLIFEAFYRGEQAIASAIRGTGLGLNIAKELIELMGGVIGVQSVLNKGSRFYFTVPFQTSLYTEFPNTIMKNPNLNIQDLLLLIVDDEPINYQYLEILLKNKVKKVDIAVNGKEAVEMALKTRYNLILMDLKMPVMSGVEATKILKAKFPDLPIIAQTAYSLPEERAYALQAGCDDIIIKPINKEKMMEMINKYG